MLQRNSNPSLTLPRGALDFAPAPIRSALSSRGFWALSDQAVVSAGTFLTNIVLARTLAAADYGVFALIYGAVLLLNNVHASLVTYPLSVEGAVIDDGALRRYAAASLRFTAILSVPLGLAAVVAAWAAHRPELGLLAVAALVLGQFQETLRRTFMAHLRYRDAVYGDAISYLAQAAVVCLLALTGHLTLATAFLAMAGTSAAAVMLQWFQLRMRSASVEPLAPLSKTYWKLGRWVLFTNLANSLTIQAFPWALAIYYGTKETANLAVVATLLGVSHPVIFSMASLIVPSAAKANAESGVAAARKIALRYAGQGAILLLPYYAALMLFPGKALAAFYGSHSDYIHLSGVLRLFVVVYIFNYIASMLGALLNGLKHSRWVFFSHLCSMVIALAAGLPMTIRVGVIGAALASVLKDGIRALATFLFVRRAEQ